jgi:hypothetical protein
MDFKKRKKKGHIRDPLKILIRNSRRGRLGYKF